MQYKNFYKRIVDGQIVQLNAHPHPVNGEDLVEITEAEYNRLLAETAQHAENVRTYTEQVRTGEITLADVPEDCREEVTRNIDAEKVENYTEQVVAETITLEEVPEQYRTEVEATINRPDFPNNSHGVDNDTYNAIIDEYTLDLMDSGLL